MALCSTRAGETRYVVEEEQTFPDGRVRKRGMLLAEKKRGGEVWSDCALRGLAEELGAEGRLRAESYRSFEEEKRSLSYPGLLSRYITHAVAVELTSDGAALGLPGFRPFETVEAKGLRHKWAWWSREACANLVGFAD